MSNEDSLVSKYFGYNFFTLRDSVYFWSNMPIPDSYTLGPGDELILSMWGETQLRETYVISRDGNIYDSKVGLLPLTGKSLKDSKIFLVEQFGRFYSTLKGNSPTSFLDISLGKLKMINFNIVGEVNFPGLYPLHPFSNIITGLIRSGGVDTTGSLRSIKIVRSESETLEIDLYDFFINGNLSKDIQLRDRDVIVVPTRKSTVFIDSSVVRPGIYESIDNETVYKMIDYAGGPSINASSFITLERILDQSERSKNKINYINSFLDYSEAKKTPVKNGDRITLRSIPEKMSKVEIIGQVKKPGFYEYYDGMKLSDLLEFSGGVDSTFLKSVYTIRAELVRRDPKTRYEKIFNVDIEKLILGDPKQDLELYNLDRFVVHANLNFYERENVQIYGEVNVPGSYPLIKDSETLQSLIKRSGGLTSKALKNGVSIFRNRKYFDQKILESKYLNKNILDSNTIPDGSPRKVQKIEDQPKWIRLAWENKNVALMPGDSIVIRESTGTVNVNGAVYNPGLIEFQPRKSLNYYINAAGGVTPDGNSHDVIVVYANGVIKPKKLLSSPKIEDGCTLIVNEKVVKEPFNITEFTTTTLSIISTTVTILVLSGQLQSQNTN